MGICINKSQFLPDGGKRARCAGGLEHMVYKRQDKDSGDGERVTGLHMHTRTHMGAHTHMHTYTHAHRHKPCSRAYNGHPEILVLGPICITLQGKGVLEDVME